jgi:predicted nucleotidyltransferase
MDLKTIVERLNKLKPIIQKEYAVKGIGVFGSYLKGEHKGKSDLDILVDFYYPIGLLKFVDLKIKLSHLPGIKVDLVMKSALKPRIGKRILNEVRYV